VDRLKAYRSSTFGEECPHRKGEISTIYVTTEDFDELGKLGDRHCLAKRAFLAEADKSRC
jgi:hypothetical protein